MPNGGSVCRLMCNNIYKDTEKCDIFGSEITPFLLCRMFLASSNQSNEEARESWSLLNELEAGVVYYIENFHGSFNKLTPAYKLKEIE